MPKKKVPVKPKSPKAKPKPKKPEPKAPVKFPIVGLGASAGGLDALKSFFSKVTKNSGMAYIVVIHMNPKQPSIMSELLQRVTEVPVSNAEDGQTIEPNHVYFIPPDKEISIFKGKMQLLDAMNKGFTLPIDILFRSLAQDQGSRSVAVILSGTGSDGTLGVKEIKSNDGLVVVQSEESAGYDGMPRSAISTGLADMVLAPEEMPKKLTQYFSHPATDFDAHPTTTTTDMTDDQRGWLNKIFSVLRTQVGRDFSSYKTNTILRRIGRRMGLNHIDSHETYTQFLRENPGEVDALFRELLIGVTSFFRDAESFEVLKTSILQDLLGKMAEDSTFRAWVPGCSTGEEVYSLVIILQEILDKNKRRINLQLFGTDIDNQAIDKAREGLFPASISADVSEGRLKRFFIKEGDFFRIRKEVRDGVVFSVQDVIQDPPFSRLNLLCCRNLLIYLDASAQKKLLPLFHYTLAPNGVLILGSSETIGGYSNLFETLDKKWKIFRRQELPNAIRHIVNFPSGPSSTEPSLEAEAAVSAASKSDIGQFTQKAVLDQFAPTAVLTDAKGEILNVLGRTGNYLETPSGPPTNNILDLAREGLRIELSSALRAAKATAENIIRKRLAVKTNGTTQFINLHVCPQKSPKEIAGKFIVVFEDIDISSSTDGNRQGDSNKDILDPSRIAELERELQVTRESHQTTIEELESSNEELKSTNEEMQSSNEELQSTNEELESSKEELQSLNEELQTVNAELQSKVEELSAAHDDMRNLLNSTEIATIFVDNNMRVRRFTAEATDIVNLIQTDIGRPLKHLVSNLVSENMLPDLKDVIENLTTKESEVKTIDEKWYNMRIIPYRTTDNRIDGAVMTFSFIGDQKKNQATLEMSMKEMENAKKLVSSIFDLNQDAMVVLDNGGKIVITNTTFSDFFQDTMEDWYKKSFIKTLPTLSKQFKLKEKLSTALEKNKGFKTNDVEIETPLGKKIFCIDGIIIKKEIDFPYRILLHFIETT